MTLAEAAQKLADAAYEHDREPEEEFLHVSKNIVEERRTELWEFVRTLEFQDKVRLIERAETIYGV